ncbi:DNA helicase INO80 [Apostasia shenzhenica]|uniref:DNA helicase n=1 Tax=Apostasia shenzhenica TaxID=1088818 RepID=A0A2I0B5W1_9ASPA|nr:DNA helicase INO80 [Apostasia shenzhenica]
MLGSNLRGLTVWASPDGLHFWALEAQTPFEWALDPSYLPGPCMAQRGLLFFPPLSSRRHASVRPCASRTPNPACFAHVDARSGHDCRVPAFAGPHHQLAGSPSYRLSPHKTLSCSRTAEPSTFFSFYKEAPGGCGSYPKQQRAAAEHHCTLIPRRGRPTGFGSDSGLQPTWQLQAIEAPKEPPRPKAHWDHVLKEMVWLSKDFESERKWKLAQAKKVATRASKSFLDQASKGEKKGKEEEQRLKKIALNISKEVKKFWMKIEKLVLYKYQLESEERKKKALDKQLDFLLGQTERYSTMLAENLVDMPYPQKPLNFDSKHQKTFDVDQQGDANCTVKSPYDQATHLDVKEIDDDYAAQSTDDVEDDEHTIEEDEALITGMEQTEELDALPVEVDLPLEELLEKYATNEVIRKVSPELDEHITKPVVEMKELAKDLLNQANGSDNVQILSNPSFEVSKSLGEITEKSQLIKMSNHGQIVTNVNHCCAIGQLIVSSLEESELHSHGSYASEHKRSTIDICDEVETRSCGVPPSSTPFGGRPPPGGQVARPSAPRQIYNPRLTKLIEDDEATLSEEEELAKGEGADLSDESPSLEITYPGSIVESNQNAKIKQLQLESELPIEELLERYRKEVDDAGSERASSSSDEISKPRHSVFEQASKLEMSLQEKFRESNPKEVEEDMAVRHDVVLEKRDSENLIADAAAAARSAQPTGNMFSTTKVRTKFPFLLKYPLREYQHIGLDWLATMYEKRLNGILADEMGLGKTIMAIALLANLACEKGIWGPHLIVVPTSVMLNWETEFLKWCPAFKILTYFGSAKERKLKRQGWLKLNSFHVCITTYRLIIQDSKVFKRKKWKYLILDEAHLIKNWKSQRWQTLLNFNSKRRILLTGTPLQNELMELWSLMHFLMPHVFQSHQEFKDWFSNPISGMVEGQEKVNKEVVDRLHNVLRPFILRRLKRDVEKQLPRKHEHVIYCRLSRRQRNLYEDFITSSETQATLASANFFGMISVIMQLRKVCNHPDLFEGRPIISSYDMEGIDMQISSTVCSVFSFGPFCKVDLKGLDLEFTHNDLRMVSWEDDEICSIRCSPELVKDNMLSFLVPPFYMKHDCMGGHVSSIFEEIQKALFEERVKQLKERATSIAWWNHLQCQKKPIYGTNLRELVTIRRPVDDIPDKKADPSCSMNVSSYLAALILSPVERFQKMIKTIESFMFAIPAARAPPPVCWCTVGGSPAFLKLAYVDRCTEIFSPLLSPFRPAIVRRQVYFPDRRLIQFDCGKLQELAILLRRLKSGGHRALIFTQMTKMLDILEAFINLYGYTYMRLDGSTQPEERQTLMQRFNTNSKYFLFILSTRSGGVGINLVGADTVIFYDSDWNPAMDQQAQDRCHRIGQTREVHIYRLISESTIEENILKKANQKRMLDDLVIQSGSYNIDFFKKLDPMELLSGHKSVHVGNFDEDRNHLECPSEGVSANISNADVEAAIKHAEDEADYMALKRVEQEEAVENQEFAEDGIGRVDDDDNEDDAVPDERGAEEQNVFSNMSQDSNATLCRGNINEGKALTLIGRDEDIDMLADVKQMAAAAAAAGQASSSFENQLRPIDRYAMRFLDLWDSLIDKSAREYLVNVDEEDWELDRIEKFKEDLEAEIDEDQEPLLYESWDADFATTAYRQHVEALAQQQLLEEHEYEPNGVNDDDEISETAGNGVLRKAKSKKKLKRTKFKSLKRGHLTSEAEILLDEMPVDAMSDEEKNTSSDAIFSACQPQSLTQKKRGRAAAVPDEEKVSHKGLKKLRKASDSKLVLDSNVLAKDLHSSESGDAANCFDCKSANRSKMGGKVSITIMPQKRVMVVKPKKFKKKGHVWSKDYFPPTDYWLTQEDAILCALVHEYGTNWTLVSDALYSFPCGGCYRGLFRHPVHCCERFRELFFKYIQSAADNLNSEKVNASGSGKSLLRVTEVVYCFSHFPFLQFLRSALLLLTRHFWQEHVRKLLNITSELPNNELLLQKHFVAILSSVWREKCRLDRVQTMLFSRNTFHLNVSSNSSMKRPRLDQACLRHHKQLVLAALNDASERDDEEPEVLPIKDPSFAVDQLDLILDLASVNKACPEINFPSIINVTIAVLKAQKVSTEIHGGSLLSESSYRIAEDRFRKTAEICLEGESPGWATATFPSCDAHRFRSSSRLQSLGKHKSVSDQDKVPKLKAPRTMDSKEGSGSIPKNILPSSLPVLQLDHFLASVSDGVNDLSQLVLLNDMHTSNSVLPPEFSPDFLDDLEDLDSQLDITDVG